MLALHDRLQDGVGPGVGRLGFAGHGREARELALDAKPHRVHREHGVDNGLRGGEERGADRGGRGARSLRRDLEGLCRDLRGRERLRGLGEALDRDGRLVARLVESARQAREARAKRVTLRERRRRPRRGVQRVAAGELGEGVRAALRDGARLLGEECHQRFGDVRHRLRVDGPLLRGDGEGGVARVDLGGLGDGLRRAAQGGGWAVGPGGSSPAPTRVLAQTVGLSSHLQGRVAQRRRLSSFASSFAA